MARQREDDWAQQVPSHRWRGPYEDYGWERGQSGLPQFRNPEVHLTRQERLQRERMLRAQQMRGDRFASGRYEPWNEPGPYTGMGPRGYRRSDERLLEEVCDRLTRHGLIDASDISVEVHESEVTLRGTVHDRRTKRMAEDVADSVYGVQDVHNELRLSGMPGIGAGRRDRVGRSGVWPASAFEEAPEDAKTQGMASWGQGGRGATGYQDSGTSELHLGSEENDE